MGILFLSIVTGLLLWLALPPFPFGFAVWIAFVPVLFLIHRESSRQRIFASCFLAGLIPVSGVVYSLIPFNPVYSLSLALGLPIYFGFLGLVYRSIGDRLEGYPLSRLLTVPCLWILTEYCLAELPLSTPLHLATSQSQYWLLIQVADIGGIYLVSFLILLVNGLMTQAVETAFERNWSLALRWSLGAIAIPVILLTYGFAKTNSIPSPDRTISLSLVQPVIASENYRDHWVDPNVRQWVQNRLASLTEETLLQKTDFIVWPEGGNGYFNLRIPEKRRQIEKWAQQKKGGILLSSLDLDEHGRKFNSLFSLDSEGRFLEQYNKRYLAPLGESTFTAGSSLKPVATSQGPVGALICFESVFSSMARELKQRGATFLLISTSDAPFRNSSLPLLHSTMAIYRAVENRFSVVQAANVGPSLLVDPWGRVLSELPFYRVGTMIAEVPIYRLTSLYTLIGNSWILLPLSYLAGLALFLRFRTSRQRSLPLKGPLYSLKQKSLYVVCCLCFLVMIPAASLGEIALLSDRLTLHDLTQFFVKKKPSSEIFRLRLQEFVQKSSHTCGPAALSYLLNYFGSEYDQSEILSQIQMQSKGTSMAELSRFAESVGFHAWGERQNLARLIEIQKPLIAYINQSHFIVVLNADADRINFFDPAISNETYQIDTDSFQRVWKGEVLRILPRQLVFDRTGASL